MIEAREPRKPRLQYHYFINLKSYMKIDVELDTGLQNIPKRILSKIRKADQKGNIKFHGDQWNAFSMQMVAPQITAWHIPKGLCIQNSKQSNLISHIVNIDFSTITSLNLTNNMISSIQSLCMIKMPNLQRLVLSNNKIHRINGLRKAYFPKLISCCLAGNRISEFGALSQLQAPLLKSISQQRRADQGWSDTFIWIGKLETNQLEKLWVPSDNRIWQRNAQVSFERKYIKRKEITFYVGLIHGPV